MRITDLFQRTPSRVIRCGRSGVLTAIDALVFLSQMREDVADIVFIDPPFNLDKDYGFARSLENRSASAYGEYMERLFKESVRVLKPGGALFLYHLPVWASRFSAQLNEALVFRHWIAVTMKNGFVRGRHLYPAHYALLYYTKGRPAVFCRPRLRPQRCRHCDELVKDYGGYTPIIMRKGINLSDVWDDLSPVRHKGNKYRKANELPVVLTDRVVKMAGRRRRLLVDPFVGTGTTLVSATNAGLVFAGNDMSRKSINVARRRLAEEAGV